MANHKRRRPKHQRAGCIFCKPWKDERGNGGIYGKGNGPNGAEKPSVRRKLQEKVPSFR